MRRQVRWPRLTQAVIVSLAGVAVTACGAGGELPGHLYIDVKA